jgi:regulator of replication initiation timing
MALQSTPFIGSKPRGFNALVNMQKTLDVADERVQLATEETFNKMQEALNQSEANNRTLQERIEQLAHENKALKLQNKELIKTAVNEKQAQERAAQKIMKRMKGLVAIAGEECEHIIKYAQNKRSVIKNNYSYCDLDDETRNHYIAAEEKFSSEMNDLHESGTNFMSQLNKLKRI